MNHFFIVTYIRKHIMKMHIQEPADKLAKTVSRSLTCHIGDRQSTLFTKPTEHGKLIDNTHNGYLHG